MLCGLNIEEEKMVGTRDSMKPRVSYLSGCTKLDSRTYDELDFFYENVSPADPQRRASVISYIR
jgi:hypothetical protein